MSDIETTAPAEELPPELTVTLRKPVTLGSETYSELRLREPTAAEWMQFDKLSGIEADVMAVSIVSGVPRPAVAMLGARDLLEGARYISRFLA